jgi:hypothetical protein
LAGGAASAARPVTLTLAIPPKASLLSITATLPVVSH